MTSNEQIAKNTLILYVRMFFVTIVSLYTSRVILQALGVDDFGIYNIAGGVVSVLGILNTSMSSATQRFLNIKLGEKDIVGMNKILNMSITIYICISILLLILGETIGLWFFYTQINIPVEKETIAQWVYQLSLLTACISIIRTPYTAVIIANERMSFFAYSSIVEVVLKLIIAFAIACSVNNRLVLYAFYMLLMALLMQLISFLYCKYEIKIKRFIYYSIRDKEYYSLVSFSGWNMLSTISETGSWQIINIFINIFLGVTLNATMGITNQVTNAVSGLIQNCQIAFKPQIIQRFVNDRRAHESLLFTSSKISFYIIFIISLPLIINIDYILGLWLISVPPYTSSFVSILLVFLMFSAIYLPLLNSIEASGKIKEFKIVFFLIQLFITCMSYLLLKEKLSPSWIMVCKTIGNVLICFFGLYYANKKSNISIKQYCNKTLIPIALVSVTSIVLSVFFSNIIRISIVNIVLSLIITSISIYIFGMTSFEKNQCKSYLRRIIR